MNCQFRLTNPKIPVTEKRSNFSPLAVLALAGVLAIPFAGGRKEPNSFSNHLATKFCYDINLNLVRPKKHIREASELNIFNAPEEIAFRAVAISSSDNVVVATVEGKIYSFRVCAGPKP